MSENILKKAEEAPHHLGHRDRLRQRFISSGAESLADYELLELLLFYAIPRKDVKPLAKDLLKKFGGFAEVMASDIEDLEQVSGISQNTAVMLKAVHAATTHFLQQQLLERPILNSMQAMLDYCHVAMAYGDKEQFRIIFLNRKNEVIADEVQQEGTIDHTPVYPREVMKRALDIGATALILVHNHPSGDPTPSQGDIDMTQDVVRAAQALNVVVHDHVIIAKSGHTSFRNLGLLEN